MFISAFILKDGIYTVKNTFDKDFGRKAGGCCG